jgi:hypothetical protein
MEVYAVDKGNESAEINHVLIGHVEAFVAHPVTGHITHLTLRKGHLWGQREITIPMSAIRKIEADEVQLNLTKPEIEALPSVPVERWLHLAQ